MCNRKILPAILLTAFAIAFPSSQCDATAPSANPQATRIVQSAPPHVVTRAKEWFRRFQTGDIDRSQLDDQVNSQLTTAVRQRESAILTSFGKPSSFTFLRSYPIEGRMGYDFLWQFAKARIVEKIAFDADGKIAGIDFELWHANPE